MADRRCLRCGQIAERAGLSLACRACQPERFQQGLGDRVASALAAVGITEARVQAVAHAVGLEDCGCEGRKAWMNRVGRRVGIGASTGNRR